jgi:hypothetical protein
LVHQHPLYDANEGDCEKESVHNRGRDRVANGLSSNPSHADCQCQPKTRAYSEDRSDTWITTRAEEVRNVDQEYPADEPTEHANTERDPTENPNWLFLANLVRVGDGRR